MSDIKPGQLRKWKPHMQQRLQASDVFLVLGLRNIGASAGFIEKLLHGQSWDVLYPIGKKTDWYVDEFIEEESDLISEGGE